MSDRPEFHNPQNWYSRGYLPHYDAAEKYQMITYRLADSLPQEVLKREVLGARASCPQNTLLKYPQKTFQHDAQKRKYIEEHLDKGYGSCLLKIPEVAEIVVDAWKFFDRQRYEIIAYVVMPTHVHILIKTYQGFLLKSVVHSWKSYTANEINKYLRENEVKSAGKMPALPAKNGVWQEDYWDRFIRDEKHFKSAVAYILDNPLKAGLCESRENWPWSFYYRHE
ncbi:MAG: transposase [Lentisphaeraceae bacterium]|nr:transposase [Lentisphaeraceae bacterium]